MKFWGQGLNALKKGMKLVFLTNPSKGCVYSGEQRQRITWEVQAKVAGPSKWFFL